jgi:ABC-type lipoprotein release transport system permease subunit
MKSLSRFELFLTLFTDQKSTLRFAFGVMLGFGFSIAVILSTMGIMDGFEKSLKHGLNKSMGDLTLQSKNGFFEFTSEMKKTLNENHIAKYSGSVQTESFLVVDEDSKGVLVKGIDESYGTVVGLPLHLSTNEVAIGREIATTFKLLIGDEIVLAFARGNNEIKNLPSLNRFKVKEIIDHGVYQKDSRLIYAHLSEVQRILELGTKINTVAMNIDRNLLNDLSNQKEEVVFNSVISKLREHMSFDYYVRPYWREFSSLIEAVKVEKVMISLILQLVVVISIFNVLAFIIFFNEKKAKELFLFRALGVSQKALTGLWFRLITLCWFLSCCFSVVFVQIFKLLLRYLSIFQLPAEIYYMPRLELYLTIKDYLFVFLMAYIWINLITYILIKRMKKKSLLEGLRQEFA